MSIRPRSTPDPPRHSIRTVESVRIDGKTRQRIPRHVGVARDDAEKDALRAVAEHIRARMPQERQPGPFPPGQVAEMAIGARRRRQGPIPIGDPGRSYEGRRVISGIHEVHGHIHRATGLDRILSAGRRTMSHRVPYHTVMARIAHPDSRRSGVRVPERDLGVSIALEKVHRMMDRPDDAAIGRVRDCIAAGARPLLPDPIDPVLSGCTALFLQSHCEGTLRAFGHGRDGRHGDVRVLPALAVTRSGLPLGHGVFPGNMREGEGFPPTPRTPHPDTRQPVTVADAGMFGTDHLTHPGSQGCRHVVGARLRSPPRALTARIRKVGRYRTVAGQDIRVGVFRHDGRRTVVSCSPERARRDAHGRERAPAELPHRPRKGTAPEQLPGKGGTHRYVRIVGDPRIGVDGEKITAAEARDGLRGVVTNPRGMGVVEPFSHCRQLWQVEEGFRITGHGLRARPVFHWTERRIRAHPALSFMAYACARHPACRAALQREPMTPGRIRAALTDRRFSVLHDPGTEKHCAIPSLPGREAKDIHATLGLDTPTRLFGISAAAAKGMGERIRATRKSEK